MLTGLLSPYIFLTKNMLLRNWSLCAQTCYIAIFSSIEPPRPMKLSFFLYWMFFFVFLFYIHFDRKGIQYRFTVHKMFGFLGSFPRFLRKCINVYASRIFWIIWFKNNFFPKDESKLTPSLRYKSEVSESMP